jgi:hypothetical protein
MRNAIDLAHRFADVNVPEAYQQMGAIPMQKERHDEHHGHCERHYGAGVRRCEARQPL